MRPTVSIPCVPFFAPLVLAEPFATLEDTCMLPLLSHAPRTSTGFLGALAGWGLLALGVSPIAGAAEPPPERAGYQIGYTAHRTNLPGGQFANFSTRRAFVVAGDGSGTRQLAPELTRKPNQQVQLTGWSPDGRQAILTQQWESPENGAWEREHKDFRFTAEHWLVDIVLLDMESRKTTNLTTVERISFYNVALSFPPSQPKRLGFLALVEGQFRPCAMDLDGKNKKALVEGANFIYGANLSPDGKRICYTKDYTLYLAGADGRNAQRVADDHPFHFVPMWSPDGRWIAYLSGDRTACHPYLIRADGTGLKKLGDRGGYRGAVERLDTPDFHSESSDIPAWSPDGKWLYYTAKVGKAVELMRVPPDGRPEQLTRSEPGVLNYLPQLSPDSKWVVFGSTRAGGRQLYVARADGSGAYPVTKLKAGWGAFHAYWRPN
jgi:Tol biopolymer transport system component